MATAIMRSGFRSAIAVVRLAHDFFQLLNDRSPRRPHHDEAAEASKWEKITNAGIATCTILAIYNLSKGHPHYEEAPPYQYLHVRSKEFPWGPDGLFEAKKRH